MEMAENPFAGSGGHLATTHSGGALAKSDQQRAIAEVQAAMMIARMNPRNPMQAMDKILNACTRPSLAETALYQFSKGGSDVSGASIRLAEAMAQYWGNIQFGFRELYRGKDDAGTGYSEVEAFAWDVENNTRKPLQFHVRHWRDTRKGGYALTDERDIYEAVASQAQRRVRACILSIIPGDVEEAARRQCEVTLKSKADTSPEGVKKMVEAFETTFGVTKSQIEKRIQRRTDSIAPAQMVSLKKIYASLRDGMSSVEDWFEVDSSDEKELPKQAEPKTIPVMTDDEFNKGIESWGGMITSGKKSADAVIKMLSSKHELTESQKNRLLDFEAAAKE